MEIVVGASLAVGWNPCTETGELSGTGTSVIIDVLMTKEAVAGGVLPPNQDVIPLFTSKEYRP